MLLHSSEVETLSERSLKSPLINATFLMQGTTFYTHRNTYQNSWHSEFLKAKKIVMEVSNNWHFSFLSSANFSNNISPCRLLILKF
jgi:hypothetical protein